MQACTEYGPWAKQPYTPEFSTLCKDVPVMIGSTFNELDFDIKTDWTEAQIMEQLAGKMGEEGAKAYADAHGIERVLPIEVSKAGQPAGGKED